MQVRLVFLGYDRPEYFAATMDSWRRALHGHDLAATLFLEPSAHADAMVEVFGDVGTVVRNPSVRGINSNNWHAIQATFTEFPLTDAVIVAEEDVVVCDDVVDYFLWALTSYRSDPQIATIGAFDQVELVGRDGLPDNAVVRWPWFYPWVWATWRERWERLLRDRWAFDPAVQGWDARVWEVMEGAGMRSILPVGSRASHIGAVGVHMLPELMASTVGTGFVPVRPVRHLVWEEFGVPTV